MNDQATIEQDRAADAVAQEPQNAGAVTVREDDQAMAVAHPASPPPPATVQMIQQLIHAASRPDTDIEKMERMFAMAEKMQASQAERQYQDAMAAAKAQIGPVIARHKNTHTNSTYADLGDIAPLVDPIIAANGFSIDYDEEDTDREGHIRVVADIMHSGGHRKRKGITVALDKAGSGGKVNKTDIQAKGSTITYARRYLKLMAFDIAITDSDGNPPPADNRPRLNDDQIREMQHLLETEGIDEATFCQIGRIGSIEEIYQHKFAAAMDHIKRMGQEQRARRAENGEAQP